MIVAIIIWFCIFALVYLYGLATVGALSRIFHVAGDQAINFSLVLLMGLVTITTIAMLVNLLLPLSAVFMLGLSAGALVIFSQRRFWPSVVFPKFSSLTGLMLMVVFLTVLENSTHVPSNADTGLYHAQTIRWFEEYRIVPGLGNLHGRLAFNSSWLVLNAAFSFAFLGLRSFRLVEGVFFLSAALYFTEGVEAILQREFSLSALLKVLFLPLSFYLLGSELSSAGTDMPVSLITWIILTLWIERLESQSPTELQAIFLFIFSLFAITLKLAAAPLVLLALWIAWEFFKARGWRAAISLGVIGAIILIPWMIRSVFLSGYLVFPVSQIDLFPVDWKMSADEVNMTRQSITGFARVRRNDWQFSMGLTFREWFSLWLKKQTLNQEMIYGLVLASPLLMAVSQFKSLLITKKHLLIYIVFAAGSLFWFASAPIIRFGYGFLIGICVLSLAPFLLYIFLKLQEYLKSLPLVLFGLVLIFQLYTLVWSFEPSTFRQRWWLPADYLPSKASACVVDNVQIYCQDELSQCNYDAFPCIPTAHIELELRGDTFQSGFRPKP